MARILIAEISGKRPGNFRQRPTEKLLANSKIDHCIVSNNSDGYSTSIPIVMVPEDYQKWYIENFVPKGGRAYYAPMNNSYAIKMAREMGYDFLVRLDDNICYLEISFKRGGRFFRTQRAGIDDFCEIFQSVLENTNAFMVGAGMSASGFPEPYFLRERFCYSCFMLNLKTCPSHFQGDFEDDIEYRLKGAQMGLPSIIVCPLKYSKTGQHSTGDTTGCRAEYNRAGMNRGKNMSKLYGDVFKCRYGVMHGVHSSHKGYRHTLKPFKVGVIAKMEPIRRCFTAVVERLGNRARPFTIRHHVERRTSRRQTTINTPNKGERQ